jgi:hypothetical protein
MCVVLLAIAIPAQTASHSGAAASFRLAGRVIDSATKAPLKGAHVTIIGSENPEFSQRVTAGANGEFSFDGLAAGKYTLLATTVGYRSQGFHQHGDYFIGISVSPSLDSEHIVFPLVMDARIEGTVTDEDGEPVRNANVQLFHRGYDTGRQQTHEDANTSTDDRGHYLFSHLNPATYFVAVSARPWYAQYQPPHVLAPDSSSGDRVAEERVQFDVAYPLTFYPSAEDSSGATPITVHPGDRVTADIAMRALPAVHLRIRSHGSEGTPPGSTTMHGFPRVSQRIFEGTLMPVIASQAYSYSGEEVEFGLGSRVRATQNQEGTYEYTGIAPGRYVIAMPPSGGKAGGWYKEMDLSGTVELDANENPPLASVTGTLNLQAANRPAGSIYIALTNRTSAETFAAEVKPKGTFDFNEMEIRPGTYDVLLNAGQGLQISALAAKGARVIGQTLEISGGSVQLAVTATGALARINGTVMQGDSPYAGAMVVLVPQNPVSNLMLFRRDQSDSDGTFSLRDVLPGAYTVIALTDGWELDWANPATLQRYLKNGVPVDISGETKLDVKVPLQ